ncbi:MAG: ergothioneine biosynthesis protein EgtB [Isosphaeraceae bacterium]
MRIPPRSTSMGDPGAAVSRLDLDRDELKRCYREVRRTTEALCEPLEVEDHVIQSMPDASPAKWHLAHTSWFFETFVLAPEAPGYRPVDPRYGFLFNSYYNAVGERIARDRRGLLSRPTVAEVYAYRAAIDEQVEGFLDRAADAVIEKVRGTIILGLHHEQQHQELIVTDIKHALAGNPLRPVYREREDGSNPPGLSVPPIRWVEFDAGLREIGHEGSSFAFDNETPRHRQYVHGFAVADRPVTNGEYLRFIEDRGYGRPQFWLSDGWFAATRNHWCGPLYWESQDDHRERLFTLSGMRDLDPDVPVCHVSYFEADAYARWAGARLPTEAEWETAAKSGPSSGGTFLESGRFHPGTLLGREGRPGPTAISRLLGDVWEWTQSPYTAYHGFRPAPGAIGEYNGKFMCNQFILRGGSCATPRSHIRATYRNFFPPEARWQFSGIRLAKDL